MVQMRMLLYRYSTGMGLWMEASDNVAQNLEKAEKDSYIARKLREWTRAFIKDRHNLP